MAMTMKTPCRALYCNIYCNAPTPLQVQVHHVKLEKQVEIEQRRLLYIKC
jgi:hypothetical protein